MNLGVDLLSFFSPFHDWGPISLKRVIDVMHVGIGDA